MTEIEIFAYAAVLSFIFVYVYRKRQRKTNHGLPYLEQAMRGTANAAQRGELADALAKSVIDRAKALNKPPLFVTVSGDLHDDFFPPRDREANLTDEQYANLVLADCVRRYRDARNNRNIDIADFHIYALCTGAGIAVSSFRCLAKDFPDMRDLAEFLAPAPGPDDWEAYKEYYLEAGLLTDVPRPQIDARLMKRRELFLQAARPMGPVQ